MECHSYTIGQDAIRGRLQDSVVKSPFLRLKKAGAGRRGPLGQRGRRKTAQSSRSKARSKRENCHSLLLHLPNYWRPVVSKSSSPAQDPSHSLIQRATEITQKLQNIPPYQSCGLKFELLHRINLGLQWEEIARELDNGCSALQCLSHYRQLQSNTAHKPWSEAEVKQLQLSYVKHAHKASFWKVPSQTERMAPSACYMP